jgi:hypothetical protein
VCAGGKAACTPVPSFEEKEKSIFGGKMKKRFDTLRNIESALLVFAGLIHIIFLLFVVDRANTPAQLYGGAMFFGVAYTVLGILIWRKVGIALPIALVINSIGLIGVITMFEQSPLRMVDPFLIAIDLVSVPLLIYLNINRKRFL